MKPLILAAVGACLAGCSGLRGDAPPPARYALGEMPPAVAAPPERLGLEVAAPDWLDSPAILYRLAYDDPARLRSYAGSRWVAAPGEQLGRLLAGRLGLPAPGARLAGTCTLRVELTAFVQEFTTPEQSDGHVALTGLLLDRRRLPLAREVFRQHAAAERADARGGVEALTRAAARSADDLARWLDARRAAGQLAACAP